MFDLDAIKPRCLPALELANDVRDLVGSNSPQPSREATGYLTNVSFLDNFVGFFNRVEKFVIKACTVMWVVNILKVVGKSSSNFIRTVIQLTVKCNFLVCLAVY